MRLVSPARRAALVAVAVTAAAGAAIAFSPLGGSPAAAGTLPLSVAEAAGQRTDDLVPTGVIRPRGRRESPGAFPSTCRPELKELAVNRPSSRKKTP